MKYNTKKRVQAGMRWLDENRPNWINQIDTDSLRIQNGSNCPLGQTGGYFGIMAEREEGWAAKHGFFPYSAWEDEEIDKLNARWVKEINKRKELVNAPKAGEEASEAHGEA